MRIIRMIETNNGYYVEIERHIIEDNKTIKEIDRYVLEDEDSDDRVILEKTINFLAEHFGLSYDKFSKENLRISWDRAGSKVDN